MQVEYPDAALPILREADVAVIGGSLAGSAAAVRLAEGGLSVVLIEPRTYLGRQITATLRPWLTLGKHAAPVSLPEPIRTVLVAHDLVDRENDGEIPLRPDTVKRGLEDALLQANISLLYASLPVGLGQTEGGSIGIVIGNKSGRQVVRCHTIIDATENALIARLAGGTFESPAASSIRFSRTLEFDRVEPLERTALPVPEWLQIVGNRIRLHRGYRGPAHLLIEVDLDLPHTPDLEGADYIEWESRRRSMGLATWLVSEYPQFTGARFAGSSHELHGRWTPSLAGPLPGWAASMEDAVVRVAEANGSGLDLPLERFAGPAPNLWCLNESSRLDTGQAAMFLDPVRASWLGESFATTLLETWHEREDDSLPNASTGRTDAVDVNTAIEIREPASPQRGRLYRQLIVPAATIPVHRVADVLVAGGGSSGATAAIVAGREGMRTVLLDMNPGLGGTGTYGGVDSYWYGRHAGFAGRLEERVNARHACLNHTGGKWNIDAKAYVLRESAHEAGVETLFNTLVFGALVNGNQVRGVAVASRWGPFAALGEVMIDATGDGDIAAFAGAAFTYGAERTHSVMWYSLAQYASPGLIRNNFTSTVDVSNIEDYTRAILAGRRRGDSTHDHGIYVATRESRHIRGGVTMTLTDQLRHRRWPDVINIHYSNHDIKGQTESDWLRSGLIPPNLEVEIPYRLVVPEGLDGILVAGKAISVTHDGLPAVRMQADLENLGGVVGLAAARAVRGGTAPRDIDLPQLQQRLVDEGLLPADVLTRDIDEREYSDAELEALIERLTGEAPLYRYSDMHMGELFHDRIPFVEICSAGERAVPLLERVHEGATGARRVLLAQALAILGSRAGVPTLIEAIERAISGDELPARDSNIRHAGFPPDQGAMPDAAYLLFSLGMTPDPRGMPVWTRVVELLTPTGGSLRDRFSGTFAYIDALSHAADRSGDPAMVPLLQHLRTHAPLRDQVCREGFQPDFFEERQAMLELGIARGLARCGNPEGYDVLVGYLDDVRALLAERAHSELIDLTGVDHGKDAAAWTAWLLANALIPSPEK